MQEVVARWSLRPSGGRMPHPVRDLMAAAERETAAAPLERWRMHRSHRFLLRMSIFLGLVAALAYGLNRSLVNAFMGNPAVNGVILGILLAGIIYIFRQVLLLDPELQWIESFRNDQAAGADSAGELSPRLPRAMVPMIEAQAERR